MKSFFRFFVVSILTHLFLLPSLFSQTPKYEVRAIWLSVASGDWPKTINVQEQQRSLVEIFDLLKSNHFNTIFFQVRLRGNTLYRSDIEPWAQQLTGELGKDPGWDPLQFALDEAHKRGMELHAWFNVAKVWGTENPPAHPKHIIKTHPDWVKQIESEWWVDMGIPEAREYTVNAVMELTSKYDIDGIQFDFIRYPNAFFDDWESFRTGGEGVERNDWRRNNITAFVRDAYKKIVGLKPHVKVGSTPIGIYQAMNGAQSSFTGYDGVFQDSRLWLKEGIQDYLAPQLYWTIGEQQNPNDPDFVALCKDWKDDNYGKHLYAGIGIYRDVVRQETTEQIKAVRNEKLEGEAFFRYEQLPWIFHQLGSLYKFPSLIPSMKWKDSIPPMPPQDVTVEYGEGNLIQWKEPLKASDDEKPFRYALYRSQTEPVDVNDGSNLLDILPADVRSFTDAPNGKKYYYAITSLDRVWNESSEITDSVEALSLISRYEKTLEKTLLAQNYPNPFSTITYISYQLPQKSNVMLSLIFSGAKKETVIVNEIKNAGVHLLKIDGSKFLPGTIEYRLTVGKDTLSGTMMKR